jgi:hypothetical protein
MCTPYRSAQVEGVCEQGPESGPTPQAFEVCGYCATQPGRNFLKLSCPRCDALCHTDELTAQGCRYCDTVGQMLEGIDAMTFRAKVRMFAAVGV